MDTWDKQMKKNFEIIIGQYVIFSNQNIGIIDAIDVIQIALKKNKFNKIFQYKKQKYIVGYTIDYHWHEVIGPDCNTGDAPGLGVNWRPD